MKQLLFPLIVFAMLLSRTVSAGEYSADSIRDFTRFLIHRGEYYRAGVELKRLASYYPGKISPLELLITDNYLLFKGRQYASIVKNQARYRDPALHAAYGLFLCDAFIALADFRRAGEVLARWSAGMDPFFDRLMTKRKIMVYLMTLRYGNALDLCGAGGDFSVYRDLVEQARRGFAYRRNPPLAAVLGILPGMGYIYAGETGTGIIAFLLVTVNVLITYFAFQTRNQVLGYFTGIIGGFFYAGSIAGGYLAAKRFNFEIEGNVRGTTERGMGLEEDRQELYDRFGIGKHGKP